MIRSNSHNTVRICDGKPIAAWRQPFYGYGRRGSVIKAAASWCMYALAVFGAVSLVVFLAFAAGYFNAIAQGREPHRGEASPGATGSTTPGNHGEKA